ncbi:MAG TPA: 2,3-bisphosphoglycerate-independent phosphoglycerate mutase [Gaiellaceae bacterium]|nr:2,3-bisphosphoglycerate-independent phosphoglycerate mutase [Gaiellaceae bacterium]
MPGRFDLVTLVILDGFGCAPPGPGNAVELAETPVFDRLWQTFPHTTIEASGEAAGLPPGQMGNSEVGHLTIGAGRRLYQDLQRVNRAIQDGSFFENPALVSAFERGKRVHLLGLVSHGGVHSHIDHLQALLQFAPEKTWVHAFTDGRDVSPTSALGDLALLPQDRLATIVGRYYAMDRDQRWDRTQRAYDAVVRRRGTSTPDWRAEVEKSYAHSVTDEFIEPIVLDGTPGPEPGDTVIFFNFRPDRGRQLTRMLLDGGFDVTTMTRYASDLDTRIAFAEQEVHETLAEVLSRANRTQLHVAETEKYAHVTYFFNGGREDAWPGESRVLVPSPRDVPSYDHKPQMSADEVADRVVDQVGDGYVFCVVNFANPDMVGHTGSIPAVVQAVETADRCLGRVVERVSELGGVCLVTADHGNAEKMLEADGISPHTAHTTNPVPLVVTSTAEGPLREGGEIADLAPTVLDLLGIPQPAAMTGQTLVKPR